MNTTTAEPHWSNKKKAKISSSFSRLDTLIDNQTRSIKDRVSDLGFRALRSVGMKVKSRYGYDLEIKENFSIRKFNDWLKTIDPKYNNRPMSDGELLSDTAFVLNIDTNTFMVIIIGDPLADETVRIIRNDYYSDNGASKSNRIKVFIYGKYAKKYITKIKNEVLSIKRANDELVIYNVSNNKNYKDEESFQSIITTLNRRDIDTLFYEDHIKEEIMEHIDSFFRNKSLYDDRNIKFKTSLLLYGEPGTGKSSLANALCNKYNLNMVLVDMNTFDKLDTNILTSCIDGDDKTYIVLLEDIDTVFGLNREGENNEVIDKDDKKVINKLLQFLDSNNSPNNVIFIATTNHVDKLDKALTRKGRIDKQFYIGPIDKIRAREMCKSFDLDNESIDIILDKYDNDAYINQSTLQGDILEELKRLNNTDEENDYNDLTDINKKDECDD